MKPEFTVMGFTCQQVNGVFYAFEQMLLQLECEGRPAARIVEIGTGYGGLTVMLGLWGVAHNTKMHTYDIRTDVDNSKVFRTLAIDAHIANVFDIDTTREIERCIQQPGTTLLLCDGGEKVREFNLLAPMLKPGDIIMAHDYWPDAESFDREVRHRLWGWLEITDADAQEIAKVFHLEPFLQELWLPYVWMCRRKTR